MKHSIKLFAITLLLSLVACSESDQENSDQIAKKETDVISIDGTKHSFTFTEDKQGNITLDKGQEEKEKTITDYFKKNQKASSYYNETDKVLYLFKNSDDMINFMTKNSKQSSSTSKKSNASALPGMPSIELLLYADANFVNLLNPNDTNEDLFYYAINGTQTTRGFEVPNLSKFRQSKNYPNEYRNIEDKISSIKLKVGPNSVPPYVSLNFHQVSVVFYEHTNFGGYSFGMTLNTYNSETNHNNLATLRMYKSWINGSKYYDNRISSYIINAN
jgi:hypothetical protein